MITRVEIDNLKNVIENINIDEAKTKEYLEKYVEDTDLLLNVLSKVKVSKIKKLLAKPHTPNCANECIRKFSEKEIIQLFCDYPVDDILNKFSLSQLKSMFATVYGHMPMSKQKKSDIVSTLKKRLEQIERVDSFNELGK